ncbi:WD repeat-containing protein RUP2 [Linum perenne]
MNNANPELPEEERARCEWDFTLRTTVSTAAVASSSDALGVIESDPSGRLIATGGIARKIRLYPLHSLLPPPSAAPLQLEHAAACSSCICTPAKLSSLRYRPDAGGVVIGCGDYDGVVTEYDLEHGGTPIFERDEHGGRRVWSVDYGRAGGAVIGASGSDDGTTHVWDPRCEGGECVAVLRPSGSGSAVCCVEFNRPRGTTLTVGCADKRVYVYDCRMLAHPFLTLDGHAKTVTYVKYLDETTLVSASIDGTLKLWDLVNHSVEPVRTYRGHSNGRNFVGLSVWNAGGLLGCGSESNQAFVYDRRWGEPIWVHGFKPVGPNDGFVSSVCWKQDNDGGQCTFVAGGSDGTLRVFEGKKMTALPVST